ncbi:DUF3999 domain-containing protein [Cupriavidus metallidurans]|uniref:Transmembrane protein n=1 Tax=Cupriavidus metallidurans (strain ATCC 43123 / DSM 2839 / NBRC 102507 / CH34) TaxID=266264 RepID=Q1LMS0_CUPMC|nr:DUF3999 domain-containing protein [Cupriavidus metallidurans]ABF08556.1 putative transmembrane protein precursor [Cupriavidus metallidurans CH34]
MIRSVGFCWLCMCLLLAPQAHAERFVVETFTAAPYFTLTLDARVYTHARGGLADLRVLNGAGEALPYALAVPRAEAVPMRTLHDVPWFPAPAAASNRAESGLGVVIGADGTLHAAGQAPGAKTTADWLLDLSRLTEPAAAVQLGLGDSDFEGAVAVQASDDLQAWQPAGTARILRVSRGDSQLLQERIALEARRTRYLRLQWQGAAPEVKGVQVETVTAQPAPPAPLQWSQGVPGVPDQAGGYSFDLAGRFPVEQVRVGLPQVNTITQATLWSRRDAQARWEHVSDLRLFRLSGPNGEQANESVTVPRNDDRYWRLSVDPRSGGLGDGRPLLFVGWQPAELTFVARGAPPFQVVVGEATEGTVRLSKADLLAGTTPAIGQARLGTMQASPAGLVSPQVPRREAWRKAVLWAALVAAVMVLGAMAWFLLRQSGRSDEKGGAGH